MSSAMNSGAQPSPLRLMIGAFTAFVAMQVAATLIALSYPRFLPPEFAAFVRTKQEGLHMPSLLGGYFVVTLALVFFYTRVRPTSRAGAALLGYILYLAVFLGGHMVTAGWSKVPSWPMAWTGFFDALIGPLGGLVLDLVCRGRRSR